jgi:hypothetical protein
MNGISDFKVLDFPIFLPPLKAHKKKSFARGDYLARTEPNERVFW